MLSIAAKSDWIRVAGNVQKIHNKVDIARLPVPLAGGVFTVQKSEISSPLSSNFISARPGRGLSKGDFEFSISRSTMWIVFPAPSLPPRLSPPNADDDDLKGGSGLNSIFIISFFECSTL